MEVGHIGPSQLDVQWRVEQAWSFASEVAILQLHCVEGQGVREFIDSTKIVKEEHVHVSDLA